MLMILASPWSRLIQNFKITVLGGNPSKDCWLMATVKGMAQSSRPPFCITQNNRGQLLRSWNRSSKKGVGKTNFKKHNISFVSCPWYKRIHVHCPERKEPERTMMRLPGCSARNNNPSTSSIRYMKKKNHGSWPLPKTGMHFPLWPHRWSHGYI